MIPTYSVSLTTDEMILLDGKVRPEIQAKVDEAKNAKAIEGFVDNAAQARFIAEAVKEAKENGILVCRHISLYCCSYTGKSAGYGTHKRNGKWHRKGETDYSKPLSMPGVDLVDTFVRVRGHATLGCCQEFWDAVRPKLAIQLQDVKAEIAEGITGHPPKWKRFPKRRCRKCGWEGHEGQMRRRPCLMGDGTYPAGCPKCDAANILFAGSEVETVAGFELVPTEE
jgi:hypothetical protein